ACFAAIVAKELGVAPRSFSSTELTALVGASIAPASQPSLAVSAPAVEGTLARATSTVNSSVFSPKRRRRAVGAIFVLIAAVVTTWQLARHLPPATSARSDSDPTTSGPSAVADAVDTSRKPVDAPAPAESGSPAA